MWDTNIYNNIIVNQKYIGTYIKVGCATRSLYASSGPKAEGVLRLKRLRNDLQKAIKGPSTRNIILSMIAGSY